MGLALAASLPSGALSAKPTRGTGSTFDAVIAAANRAAAKRDCDGVVRVLGPRITDAAFSTYPADTQSSAYDLLARCDQRIGKLDDAYHVALIATRTDVASDEIWRIRLGIELGSDKIDQAVSTVAAMADGRGAALNSVPMRWLFHLDSRLKEHGDKPLWARFLAILTASAYQPDEPGWGKDDFRQDYAELLYAMKREADALAVARQIEDPATLVRLSVDPRFRSIVPDDFDARAVAEHRLAELHDLVMQHPAAMLLTLEQSSLLRRLGRPQEAIDLLRQAHDTNEPPSGDVEEPLNWWWEEMARAHAALGQYDNAVAAFRQGDRVGEGGNPNVSQVINLAGFQTSSGRPREALATLTVFDTGARVLSAFGAMQMRAARACAARQAGDAARANDDLGFIRVHRADAPKVLRNLLLCFGDLDAAAAEFINDLGDPERGGAALLDLSDYDPPLPNAIIPIEMRRLSELKARTDIRAAIARAGGIRRINLQHTHE